MRIIRGKYGRRRFDVPTNITARPTTDFARENIFNVIENLVDFDGDEPCALDLFAGTGAVSFEFLSRGCSSVTSVEKSAIQSRFISYVCDQLKCTNHTLIRGDVFKYIATCRLKFDIVFADPPYNLPDFEKVVPAVTESGIVAEGGIFIIEHSRDRDYSSHPWFVEHRAYGSVNFSILINKAPSTGD